MRQHTAGPRSGSGVAIHTIASEQDRVRAFRAARRHTWFVRFFRLVLPVVAVVALAGYGARMLGTKMLASKGVEVANVRIDAKSLVMETPKYDGFGQDGSRYQVRARDAVMDIRQRGPVRLNAIEGEITQATGAVTRLEAVWGTYDQKTEVLELHEKIDIDGSTGMKARLTRATVMPKESRVVSTEPVWAQNETGTITARSMTLETKARRARFADDVQVRLEANRPSRADAGEGAAKAGAAKPRAPAPLPGLAANTGQPIEVRADALEVDDGAKTALFRRNVVARQGDASLEAPELDVVYTGKGALDAGGTAPPTGEAATKLETIRARGGVATRNKDDRASSDTLQYDAATERAQLRGNVVITSGTERRITAGTAEFDQKADTALLTGDVVATQGRNVLRGRRLLVDRKHAMTRLDSLPGDGQPAGRITTVFYQNEQRAGAAKPAARASEPAADGGVPMSLNFKSDPDAPVEVEADTLEVHDARRNAVFHGNVVAKQGDFVVRTVELTAHYSGQAGLGSVPPPTGAAKGEAGGAAQLTRIEARQKVVVTSKDGRQVIGDWADFDVKANLITVGGKVTVSDGRSSIDGPEGSRLVVDMVSGQSRFEQAPAAKPVAGGKGQPAVSAAAPASSAASSGAPDARPGQPPCPEGLVCSKKQFRLVLYPKQVEEKAKAKLDKAAKDGWAPAAVAKDIVQEKRKKKTKPEASSWDASTSTPESSTR